MKRKIKTLFFLLIFFAYILVTTSNYSIKTSNSKAAFSSANKNIIYLTFDDGPSSIVTNNILDVLKEQNVKATFFIIGNNVKGSEDVLKRIYKEGHSIGLHTYSHQYKQIYSSENSFIEEMIKTSEEINRVIGIKPNIIRFPYGSNCYLNNDFLVKLHNNNFKVYDWNASISDGTKPYSSPEEFAKEAIARGSGIPYIVFLMHCNNINVNTSKALPQIIQHYKKLGYEFRTITNNTPEFYWRPSK
ncbi:polysaccharide deacetylase [Clostridium sp. CX1]|uniref:Polysaccharide deacetylase n=1 Tax=Clostridium tanneri TaxID=3037988 RepID=A0ABU4JVF7_9CLOT|nr:MULTISPECIES: polysaccharide deacetylase family protein [unclassified Clostridium]MCT8975230.1 polysaccharide deacetylase [Clostridium sp. CX1]MDW8802132.1 polysaccharide deacetylase [Clostridium sp. A1-XYC3]